MISSECNLQTELDHLQKVFCDINQYPVWKTKRIIAEELEKHQNAEILSNENENEMNPSQEEEIEMVQLTLRWDRGVVQPPPLEDTC